MNPAILKQNREAELKAAAAILDKSASENNRALTAEEVAAVDAHTAKADELTETIKRGERLAALAPPPPPAGLEDRSGLPVKIHENAEDKPFETFGHFLLAVRNAADPEKRHMPDPRLLKRAATGMSEGVLSDGGFLVNQETSMALMKRVAAASVLLGRTRSLPLGAGSNGIKLPYVDETSRANGSRWGGVNAYWADEAAEKTASKPKLGRLELNLRKLVGLCYATDELLEDATALGGFMEQAFTEEFAFRIDDAIIRGTGVGQPLGILNSNALISVAKETSQTAATIVAENIIKMRARLWARSWGNAVWYTNQDTEPSLLLMTIKVKNVAGSENVGGSAAYLPPGGLSQSPYGMLLGRPVVPIEQASTLGTKGDIILADLSQYLTIAKEMQQASSIHVRFIYDESVFRFVQRIDGQPAWKQALTPAQGTNTISPFVALDTRA